MVLNVTVVVESVSLHSDHTSVVIHVKNVFDMVALVNNIIVFCTSDCDEA